MDGGVISGLETQVRSGQGKCFAFVRGKLPLVRAEPPVDADEIFSFLFFHFRRNVHVPFPVKVGEVEAVESCAVGLCLSILDTVVSV